ncbi:hypothetical protein ACLIA0_07905 [Bacillaceae bacterium W0354]
MKHFNELDQALHHLNDEVKLSQEKSKELLTQINEKIDKADATHSNHKWKVFALTAVAIALFAIMIPLFANPGQDQAGPHGNKPILPQEFQINEGPASFEYKLPSFLPFEVVSSSGMSKRTFDDPDTSDFIYLIDINYNGELGENITVRIIGHKDDITLGSSEYTELNGKHNNNYYYLKNDAYQQIKWIENDIIYEVKEVFSEKGSLITQEDLVKIADSFVPYDTIDNYPKTLNYIAHEFAENYNMKRGVVGIHLIDDEIMLLGRINEHEFVAATIKRSDSGYQFDTVTENLSLKDQGKGSMFGKEITGDGKKYSLLIGKGISNHTNHYNFINTDVFFNVYENINDSLGYHEEDLSLITEIEELVPSIEVDTEDSIVDNQMNEAISYNTVKFNLKLGMTIEDVLDILKVEEPSEIIEDPRGHVTYRFDTDVRDDYTIEETYVDIQAIINGKIGMQTFVSFNNGKAFAISALYKEEIDDSVYHYHLTEQARFTEAKFTKTSELPKFIDVEDFIIEVPSQQFLEQADPNYDKNQFISLNELYEQMYDEVHERHLHNVFQNYRAGDTIYIKDDILSVEYDAQNDVTYLTVETNQGSEDAPFSGDLTDRLKAGGTVKLKFELTPKSADGLYVDLFSDPDDSEFLNNYLIP